ncbi:MAG: hypothetical protein ACP5P4_16805 [Steroidobacteraceae bacterium]
MTRTKVLIGQNLIVFGIVMADIWYAIEWTAAALRFQMRLGGAVVPVPRHSRCKPLGITPAC